jgi:hypothetical protein
MRASIFLHCAVTEQPVAAEAASNEKQPNSSLWFYVDVAVTL